VTDGQTDRMATSLHRAVEKGMANAQPKTVKVCVTIVYVILFKVKED